MLIVLIAACNSNDAPAPGPSGSSDAISAAQQAVQTQTEQPSSPPNDDQADDQGQQAETPSDPATIDPLTSSESAEPDAALVPTPPAPTPDDPAPHDNAYALEFLRQLTVEIGPRVQGTAGEQQAADLIAAAFASFGYSVEQHRFSIPSIETGTVAFEVTGAEIAANAFTYSESGIVQGRLVAVPGVGTAQDFAQVDVDNAIALVAHGDLLFTEKIANAVAAGAIAIVIYNNAAGKFSGNLGTPVPIPAVSISNEDGLALCAQAEQGTVNASVLVEGGGALTGSQNVIARSNQDRCRILIGGHYDTVANIPGANDNSSGTALVVTLARAFAGIAAHADLCFVAFGAEEGGNGYSGLAGSRALVNTLEVTGAIASAEAMLNLDAAAIGTEIILVGTSDLPTLAAQIASALGIDAVPGSLSPKSGSDHLSFDAAGVPVIFPTVRGGPIRTLADNFSAVQPERLDQVGRIGHALLACLMERVNRTTVASAACPVTMGN